MRHAWWILLGLLVAGVFVLYARDAPPAHEDLPAPDVARIDTRTSPSQASMGSLHTPEGHSERELAVQPPAVATQSNAAPLQVDVREPASAWNYFDIDHSLESAQHNPRGLRLDEDAMADLRRLIKDYNDRLRINRILTVSAQHRLASQKAALGDYVEKTAPGQGTTSHPDGQQILIIEGGVQKLTTVGPGESAEVDVLEEERALLIQSSKSSIQDFILLHGYCSQILSTLDACPCYESKVLPTSLRFVLPGLLALVVGDDDCDEATEFQVRQGTTILAKMEARCLVCEEP